MYKLSDYFKLNNTPYDELEQGDKARIDRFVKAIVKYSEDEKLLKFDPAIFNMVIIEWNSIQTDYNSTIPEDLSKRLTAIWNKSQTSE